MVHIGYVNFRGLLQLHVDSPYLGTETSRKVKYDYKATCFVCLKISIYICN